LISLETFCVIQAIHSIKLLRAYKSQMSLIRHLLKRLKPVELVPVSTEGLKELKTSLCPTR
jgi:hypothetical protein